MSMLPIVNQSTVEQMTNSELFWANPVSSKDYVCLTLQQPNIVLEFFSTLYVEPACQI